MEKEQPVEPYEFTFAGGEANSYFFTTQTNVIYEIKFIPSTDYFSGYEALEVDVFEMVIAVADNPGGGRLPADARTAPTIFTIFEHFFLPNRHALIFICDSSDGRERARFRKFTSWFYDKNTMLSYFEMDLTKFDLHITDGNQMILISLIFSQHHPQQKLVVDIFLGLGREGK
jgi:hypothetical protein